MSIEKVREYLKPYGKDMDIIEHKESTATVEEAARALNVMPAQIAKTLSFRGEGSSAILILFAGDARADNRKFKEKFHHKASMLTAEEVVQYTGHHIGGVCPFALPDDMDVSVYLDVSLKRFKTVYPACGSDHSGIPMNMDELFRISHAEEWIDVGKSWDPELRD